MSARETFESLGYEYDYKQGELCENTITYHKDNLHIQFNLTSKLVVLQNDTSHMFYNASLFMVNMDLLNAIAQQILELKWKE